MKTVIGVDGCRAGWIAVIWGETVEHRLFTAFAGIVELNAQVLAIDIPIGLPDVPGRSVEASVRKFLGGKKSSSVFSIPARTALQQPTIAQARHENLRLSGGRTSVTLQSFAIAPKINEVDQLMSADMQGRIYETHPEVCFAVINGGYPVLSPKRKKHGKEERLQILRQGGFPIDELPPATYRKSDVGDDDLLDACACAWAARRIAEGRAMTFPSDPPRDARGLRMSITV